MSSPRFVLVVGGPRSGSSLLSWPHGGASSVPEQSGTWFAWRLLGGNNRELGRSASAHLTSGTARAAARRVQDGGELLVAAVMADAERGMWGWRVSMEDGVHALSSRLYLRQRECQYSLRQFLDGLGRARLWDEDEPSVPAQDGSRRVIDLTGPVPRVSVSGGESRSEPRRGFRPTSSASPDRPMVAPRRSTPPASGSTTRARAQVELIRRRPAPEPGLSESSR